MLPPTPDFSKGFTKIFILDRTKTDNTILGSSYISNSVGIEFSKKPVITQVSQSTGKNYSSQYQFLIYDSPYVDTQSRPVILRNGFFLIVGVDKDKKPGPIKFVNIKVSGH